MKNRVEASMINGGFGVVSNIVISVLNFISRKIFIDYLSVTYLGYNGLFTDVLNLLNLTEMGIGTALNYRFYEPVAQKNSVRINQLLHLYKIIYRFIGIVVLGLGIAVIPAIPMLIADEQYDIGFARIVFIIQLIGVASSYFCAYRRTLFVTDQKEYICTIVDTSVTVLFTIVRILSIVIFKNYIIYLALQIMQNVVANMILYFYAPKKYRYVKKVSSNTFDIKNDIKEIFLDCKEIIGGKIGVFVYSSTDNIIISSFLGLNMVGLVSNYALISKTLVGIVDRLLNPIQASLGNLVHSKNESVEHQKDVLNKYTFIRFVFSNLIFTGLAIYTNPVIELVFGKEYSAFTILPWLYAFVYFSGIIQGSLSQFISVMGLFEDDKRISYIGAAVNLSSSIILGKLIGINGVKLGTVFAQIAFWYLRARIVYDKHYKDGFLKYLLSALGYTGIAFINTFISYCVALKMLNGTLIMLLISGIISIAIVLISDLIIYGRTSAARYFTSMAVKMIKRMIKSR